MNALALGKYFAGMPSIMIAFAREFRLFISSLNWLLFLIGFSSV